MARRTRVLIVDDHETVQAALTARLAASRDLEIAATTAASDDELVEALRFEPDVVLLDVKRRHGGGIGLCRRIIRERPSTRVLVLTSYPDETERSAVRAAGADGYLLKDLDLDELLHRIGGVESDGQSPVEGT